MSDKKRSEMTTEELKQSWASQAKKHLLGRKITAIRYLTSKETEALDWSEASIALCLDGREWIYPSRDDEGNAAGALLTTFDKFNTIPVIAEGR